MKTKHSKSSESEEPPDSISPSGKAILQLLGQLNLQRASSTLSPSVLNYFKKDEVFISLQKIQTEVVKEIKKCKALWNEFSPKKSVFDTWDFRYSFWKGYKHEPHFLVLKKGEENKALLPLQFEKDKQKYFWFGSWWQEDNSFFVKDDQYIPLLISVCPSPAHLNAITLEAVARSKKLFEFKPDEPKYILPLKNIKSSDDFLLRLSSKKRYNIRRDRKIIQSQNPNVIVNNFRDFDKLIELSKRRFAQKGESTDWEDERRVETFRQVIKQGQKNKSFEVRMLTVKIEDKIAAVDLITVFKGVYAPLKCGYDVTNFPGIGNFVNLLEIDDALSLGVHTIDFLEVNYGWKDRWFEAVPLFVYDNSDEKK